MTIIYSMHLIFLNYMNLLGKNVFIKHVYIIAGSVYVLIKHNQFLSV